MLYQGSKTSQISFPLGGIGSGCIGLAGNGRLIDWEIFNRPNKGSVNGFSHFAIRVEDGEAVKDVRILHGNLLAPYQGEMRAPRFSTSGWGPRREHMTGLPHFNAVDFRGEFPLAELSYRDETFPGNVKMLAFNPFIPTNEDDSSIPAAFVEFSITNTTDQPLTYTLVGALTNPLPANNLNSTAVSDWGTSLHLASDGVTQGEVGHGDLTIATDAALEEDITVSYQQYWYRGTWFDNLEVYWNDLNTPGPLKNRVYDASSPEGGVRFTDQDTGLLAAHIPVGAGETRQVRFVISWSFPTCENYWKTNPGDVIAAHVDTDETWQNYYATLWHDSKASAQYALENWSRLYEETKRFKDALFGSQLPPVALDAVSANISILKSPTCLRLEDGTFYGWEGLHLDEGCCEGSCTHVWNYQQALAFLFPALERSMRDADYKYNLLDNGAMPFRLQLPIGSDPWPFRPCCDGQFGGVMKAYRDWKICGDDAWLMNIWPAIKSSLEYAWSPNNVDRWDPDRSGVLTGRQHHTLDMELFGPNSWLNGFYLGALKAASEMAAHLGEDENAAEYLAIFERGKAWMDENLFNGEYYFQRIDLGDRTLVESYGGQDDTLRGGSALDAYWNSEHNEIKYQIGEGSSIDQILPQWHASLYGLGDLYDPAQTKQASAAIYKYNFIPEMGQVYNPCRIYCLNDEGGLVICAWPDNVQKPLIPAPYSQETMNGFEYSAAIHMIMLGQIDEGMRCIEAIRQRYDGERRNPWNEFECGNNYARSMASYALLNAFSGFQFDMVEQSIGFAPIQAENGSFRCFWSLDAGWGEYEQTATGCNLSVLYGDLPLKKLKVPALAEDITSVSLDQQEVAFTVVDGAIVFKTPIQIETDAVLVVNC